MTTTGFEILVGVGSSASCLCLDCCDREIISYIATTSGITGEMVRDLMVESINARFGRLPCFPMPWNGSVAMQLLRRYGNYFFCTGYGFHHLLYSHQKP